MTQEIGIYRREDLLMEKGSRLEQKKNRTTIFVGLKQYSQEKL